MVQVQGTESLEFRPDKSYPLGVSNSDGSIVVRRTTRECAPGTALYMISVNLKSVSILTSEKLDQSDIGNPKYIIVVPHKDFAAKSDRVIGVKSSEEVIALALRIAPAIAKLHTLFYGEQLGSRTAVRNVIFTDEDMSHPLRWPEDSDQRLGGER